MRRGLWILIFLIVCRVADSQTTVQGKLTDGSGTLVSGVNVMITAQAGDEIIAYAVSDNKGYYKVTFSSSSAQVDIHVSCMGYAQVVETIKNESQTKNFKLSDKAFELKDVVVKSAPITQHGDTINYLVSSFAKDQDRSIGDVLKRIPGIEVRSDGRVFYQGKPINRYYINGLDLLEGRYDLANENLPHKEVSQVQVFEKHQPVKALKNYEYSESAALNIKLKNDYTFTGRAVAGGGASPLLWDVNITPMLFSKKGQMITTYQANNTGDNVASQLNELSYENLFNTFEGSLNQTNWVSINKISAPDFSPKRWFDNNIHMLSSNYLQKLKKDYELRLNVFYVNDYQQQNGSVNTQIFTPTNTVLLSEKSCNKLFVNQLSAVLNLEKNTEKNYLKNKIEFQSNWDSQRGDMLLNDEELNQHVSNHYFKISNTLKSILPLGKQRITFNSFIGIDKTPQTLDVNPGQFASLLNNGKPYESVSQHIELETLYANNAVSFIKKIKQITLECQTGFLIENQHLKTDLSTSENISLGDSLANNLHWLRSKLYLEMQTQYKMNKWLFELKLPINFHAYRIEDKQLKRNENLTKILSDPFLSVSYDMSSYFSVRTSAMISNSFGSINQLHYAYILQNYRNVVRVDTPLPQTSNQSFSGSINYKNPIDAFFWSIIYSNSRTKNNLLYQTNVMDNGAIELQAKEQDNLGYSQNVGFNINKYFTPLKSNLTFNCNWGESHSKQSINDVLTKIKNYFRGIGGKIDTDITSWFAIEYKGNWTFTNSVMDNKTNPMIRQQNHIIDLNFIPSNSQFISFTSEYIYNNLFSESSKKIFSDCRYRYSIKKKNIDFELQLNNIFNTKNYRTVNVNEYSYVETSYKLRPRQGLIKVRFGL